MKFFLKIDNKNLLFGLIYLLLLKFIFFLLYKQGVINLDLGGANDADYYHSYALGLINIGEDNLWNVILRNLYNRGFYSREMISYFFLFCNLFLIPILTTKLASLRFKGDQKLYLYCYILVSIYPTLYFYTFDIYRDEFMVLVFLLGCLCVKNFYNTNNVKKTSYLLLIFYISYILFGFRTYLGFSFISAFLLSLFLPRISLGKIRLTFIGLIWVLILYILNNNNYLTALTDYRESVFEEVGGSTLGLNFNSKSSFLPNLILSFLGQFLGLFIVNINALFLFMLESVPIFIIFKKTISKFKTKNSYLNFMIAFSIIYGSIWLIANDNLGTAARLRMFNYMSIYIMFFYLYNLYLQSKNLKSILD